jgi:hypothetical protein
MLPVRRKPGGTKLVGPWNHCQISVAKVDAVDCWLALAPCSGPGEYDRLAIRRPGRDVFVRYDDRLVTYDFGELDEVSLAYAITIHSLRAPSSRLW